MSGERSRQMPTTALRARRPSGRRRWASRLARAVELPRRSSVRPRTRHRGVAAGVGLGLGELLVARALGGRPRWSRSRSRPRLARSLSARRGSSESRAIAGSAAAAFSRFQVVPAKALDRGGVEQVGVVLGGDEEPVLGVSVHEQRQVEARRTRSTPQGARLNPGSSSGRAGAFWTTNITWKSGDAAEVALAAAAPRPASRTARPGGRRRRARLPHAAPAARGTVGIARQVGAQHEGVDEEADQPSSSARWPRPAMGVPTARSSWPGVAAAAGPRSRRAGP